ncbi:MAG: hypothetical protein J2P52_12045 [Blastocatellia bacterium]|nr:hypothetical protein [Blastocatellia bacterium]
MKTQRSKNRAPKPISNRAVAKTKASDRLLENIRALIEQARAYAAQNVNSALVILNWHVGHNVRKEILQGERAEYGEQIIATLSGHLSAEYGRGYSRTNLFNMVRFAEVFPDVEIVQTLSGQLSWSHFLEIIPLKNDLQRDFYAEMCRLERWSVRMLRNKIAGMLFETGDLVGD